MLKAKGPEKPRHMHGLPDLTTARVYDMAGSSPIQRRDRIIEQVDAHLLRFVAIPGIQLHSLHPTTVMLKAEVPEKPRHMRGLPDPTAVPVYDMAGSSPI
jgi:hypothetical protein